MDFMRFILLLICCAFLQTAALAQNTLPPIEAYGALPDKNMMVISPSGDRIAYRTQSADKDYVVVFDLTTNKMVAAIDAADVNPKWTHFIDEDRILFLVSESKKINYGKRSFDDSAAFIYELKSNKFHQVLTAGNGIYAGQAGLGWIVAMSEDRKYAYMPAWIDAGKFGIVRANLDRKRRPKVISKGISDAIDYFVESNGDILARERYDDEANIHKIEVPMNDRWRTIYSEEKELFEGMQVGGISPDKKHLIVSKFDEKLGRWGYYKLSLESGDLSQAIFIREDADVESLITDINRVVYGAIYSGFKPSYEFFDPKYTKLMENIAVAMPNNSFYIADHTPDFSSFIFRLEGESSPGDYYKFSKGQFQFISSSRDKISPEQVHPVSSASISARDGVIIPTLITSPLHKEINNLPAVMLPHGGPRSYDRIKFNWLAQYFASQGYLVIQPQFRGSTGFGEKHKQLGDGQWGLSMQDDLTDTLQALVKQGKVDKDRICIVGWSYGGYAALAGVAFEPDLYRCAVSINGLSDVHEMLIDTTRYRDDNHWLVAYWEKVAVGAEVSESHLQRISPIHHVDNIKVPVLLIHGERDNVVPVKQSELMYEKLIDSNKEAQFIELNDGDHSLTNFQNRMAALKAIDVFIKKHI